MAREFTRKKLKQDEFVDGMWSAEQWIEHNWDKLLKWAAAAAVVALIVVAGVLWQRSRTASAQRTLSEGINVYAAATDPANAGTAAADLAPALALFEQAASRGGGAVGRVARYYRAAALVRMERGEEAIPVLEQLTGAAEQDMLGAAARMLLADALSQAGQQERAIEVLRAASAGSGPYVEQALFQLGVLLEAQGRVDEARDALRDLRERYPNGPLGGRAQARLDALG